MTAAPPRRIDRKISLSDAVIGIAATLLILDVKAPVGHSFSEEGMLAFLAKVGDQLVACLVTFVLIGAYWMQHRRIVDHLARSSATVAWMNLGFLFLISLTPFSAALLNAYPDDAAAIVLFGGIHLLCGLSLTLVWVPPAFRASRIATEPHGSACSEKLWCHQQFVRSQSLQLRLSGPWDSGSS